MKRVLLLIFGLTFWSVTLWATHYRAGELTYENLSYLTYRVTVTTYTTNISGPPDSDTITIHWGDGTTSRADRSPSGGTNIGNDIKRNSYVGTHTYIGPRPFFVIHVADPNRISGIKNINGGNSINVQFYIEDTLRVYNPSFIGENNSPILLNPPIDYANINQIFIHNPAAYDPDGDSLTFELVTPLSEDGGIPVPNYQLPDQISPGINNNISINAQTGEVLWDSPKQFGVYNIAILIREYREGLLMGTVLRDMEIFVEDEPNRPPVIAEIHDTCIIAGSTLSLDVFASDFDLQQRVTLSATGGPFQVANNPAVFVGNTNVGFATGVFEWQTNCSHIRDQFYQVVFKAEDDYRVGSTITPLTDLETWIIRVVAPPPQNLVAEAVGNLVNLTWNDPYACGSAQTDRFIGFSVWRKEGCDNFAVDTCEPGLNGKGYTLLADGLFDTNYTDSTAVRGKAYSYRILAEFADQAPLGFYYNNVFSLASNEACTELKRDLPLITNVTVESTDAATGEIFVRWLKPLADSLNLDTVAFPGPYQYQLFGEAGFANPAGLVPLVTYTGATFATLVDTTFSHTGLNTVAGPHTYRIDFYSNGGTVMIGSSEIASSVFLTVGSNDNMLDLSWESVVPWNNFLYRIYKFNESTSLFSLFDTTSQTTYVDATVTNDSNYCYYIESLGKYTANGLEFDTLYNLSQEACAIPIDTIAPCPPVIIASNDCGNFNDGESCELGEDSLFNEVAFTLDTCDYDVRRLNIYYALPGETEYLLIDSVITGNDSVYAHRLQNTLAGCYIVTALDEEGNESEPSNVSCVGNCPCYILPNVFTPNGDGDNDFYIPILPYRFVQEVDMKIFNRWGVLVYETSNPDLGWDGNDSKTGKPLGEDVYYYVCKVVELGGDGLERKDPIILSGYIHLIRGNGNSN